MGTSKRPGGVPGGGGSVTSALEGWRCREVEEEAAARDRDVAEVALERAARGAGRVVAAERLGGVCERRRVPLRRHRRDVHDGPRRGEPGDRRRAQLLGPTVPPTRRRLGRARTTNRGGRGRGGRRAAEEGEPEEEEELHAAS